MKKNDLKIYFSDFFSVSSDIIEEYGAINISLINDLPLFIDPFLLFGSENKEYHNLHIQILDYLRFLRDYTANDDNPDIGTLKSLFCFSEVKQTWLGFSLSGNAGSGLGMDFARKLHENLKLLFTDFGSENVTQSSHLEKLCILSPGVGRDCISDFTTNLIIDFLLAYTEKFAISNIRKDLLRAVSVPRAFFDYKLMRWMPKIYQLPFYRNDYIILTPKDILTKQDTWINHGDMVKDIERIADSLPDSQIRSELNRYLLDVLRDDISQKYKSELISKYYLKHPELIDYYIKNKEDRREDACRQSIALVLETESVLIANVKQFASMMQNTSFYDVEPNTYEATQKRIEFLKNVIENNDGYKLFYHNNKPIKRESDLQTIFKFTWFASKFDVNREVNNGRGPVDYKISYGNSDKTLVEFKLASNSKLKQNLEKQVEIYKKANNTEQAFKVIMYFSDKEYIATKRIIDDLKLQTYFDVYLIDAQLKCSASNAK